jgi:hypothetical protein
MSDGVSIADDFVRNDLSSVELVLTDETCESTEDSSSFELLPDDDSFGPLALPSSEPAGEGKYDRMMPCIPGIEVGPTSMSKGVLRPDTLCTSDMADVSS